METGSDLSETEASIDGATSVLLRELRSGRESNLGGLSEPERERELWAGGDGSDS